MFRLCTCFSAHVPILSYVFILLYFLGIGTYNTCFEKIQSSNHTFFPPESNSNDLFSIQIFYLFVVVIVTSIQPFF